MASQQQISPLVSKTLAGIATSRRRFLRIRSQ
jgi:hypothetical protein